jgi:hypothetical protein
MRNVCQDNPETASHQDCRLCSSDCIARRGEMSILQRGMFALFCFVVIVIALWCVVSVTKWIF